MPKSWKTLGVFVTKKSYSGVNVSVTVRLGRASVLTRASSRIRTTIWAGNQVCGDHRDI